MKLQLFSTGKELPPQAHPLFADLASWVFPALQLAMSSPIWIYMTTGVRPTAVTAWTTAAFTMAIFWLWTVLRSPGTVISLWPACRESSL